MEEDGCLPNRTEEILEWVKGNHQVLFEHIQKLNEEFHALRETLRETWQKVNGQADETTKIIPHGFNLALETQNIQRQWILGALAQSRGKIAKAARLLGISRPCLYDKIQTLGIATAKTRFARQTKQLAADVVDPLNGARTAAGHSDSTAPAYASKMDV